MKLFKNEFRKNFSIAIYIVFVSLLAGYLLINYGITNLYYSYGMSNEYTGTYAIGFTIQTVSTFMQVIIIFSILTICNTFSRDYKLNTWKNLLCTGTHKNKIHIAKFVFSIFQCLIYLIFTYIVSFLVGFFIYGFNSYEKIEFTTSNGLDYAQQSMPALEYLLKSFLLNIIIIIFYVTFISLFAELLRGNKLTMLFTYLLYFFSNMIYTVIQIITLFKPELKFLDFLPFRCAYPGAISPASSEMLTYGSTSIVYSTIFLLLGLLLFRKRDIPTSR